MSCGAARLGYLLSAAFVLTAATVHAQGIDEFGRYGPRTTETESKQVGAFELRIGRYVPRVDDEFSNGQTPYRDMFGTKNRYSVGFEVDWQVLRIPYFGTLGPGLGVEYTKISADSLLASDPTQRAPGETTSLTLLPIYVVGVARFDYLARQTPVPLVPYAKLGVGSALWWVSNGGGTASVNGTSGRGLSFGPQFALGGMFLLDFLDPSSAATMDESIGINNSYFFTEWFVSYLGTGNQMHVGTNTWVLGLAFEF